MKLRGTENDRQSDTIINANPNSTLITESDLHDMQRLLYTELGDN